MKHYFLEKLIGLQKFLPGPRTAPTVKEPHEVGLEFVSGPIPDAQHQGWYVFSTVRNEILRLPWFLQYYREMGAALFVIADNDSNDGTTEYLTEQPDVLLFRASGSYSASRCGVDWLNALLHLFGPNRWCLTVDADELLVFPHHEQLNITELTRYLDASGANALPTFLLDMYSRGPIREATYQAGLPFLSVCPFFDATAYVQYQAVGSGHKIPARGGPRHRLFWEGRRREKPSPLLVKFPLVRWSASLYYKASTHILSNAINTDVTGALLHFKFFSDFADRVDEESQREEHFSGAAQYSAYQDVIAQANDVSAYYHGSTGYQGSKQLMDLGLIHSSEVLDQQARSRQTASVQTECE